MSPAAEFTQQVKMIVAVIREGAFWLHVSLEFLKISIEVEAGGGGGGGGEGGILNENLDFGIEICRG